MPRFLLLVAALAACGVTAPSRVDLNALVKKLGPVDARHELQVRVVKDPKDVRARLALAKLCDQQGRPSQAIEQLEAVVRIGGPIGTRWHDEDRARFARLLAARGRARIARGAPSALADLERAKAAGAKVAARELEQAKLAKAIVHLLHVDANERATGAKLLRGLAPDARWRGLAKGASLADGAETAGWLWSLGAKRAAWQLLAAWHDATPSNQRDERLQSAYLVARAWWTPVDAAPPDAGELVGPERCRFRGANCSAWDLAQNALSSDAITALVLAPASQTSDPEEAFAWLAISLARSLRVPTTTSADAGSWGARFAGRVDTSALAADKLPPAARAAFALLTGRDAQPDTSDRSVPARYLAAAVAAWRDAKPDEVRAHLGTLAETPDGAALLAIASPPARLEPAQGGVPRVDPYAAAVARYVRARAGIDDAERVAAILEAYARAAAATDRVVIDVVAEYVDAAEGHALAGAVFDAIQDPARARASWQAAVDGSPDPRYLRGLAEAIARAGDPDAALVAATRAAAASGDPSPVWIAVADALHANGSHVHALEAARSAIDLASAETLGAALDVAVAASDALGRVGQADRLRAERAKIARTGELAGDPTDPAAALASAHVDRMWKVSRWNPRDVALRAALLPQLDEARRDVVVAELVELAGGADIDRARAAIRVLRER